MKLPVILLTAGALFLASCGGEKAEEKKMEEAPANNPFAALEQLGKAAEQMGQAASKQEEVIKKRREKGDTLALPYEELQKFLPAAPAGFKAEAPDGATVKMGAASYSNAEVKFKKENGDWVKVTIVDYNQAYGIYSAATAMWAAGMSVDTPTERANGIKMDEEIAGWETYHKKNKDATVALGVGYRFWVAVEANNQENTDFIKSVVKTMDLKKLSGM